MKHVKISSGIALYYFTSPVQINKIIICIYNSIVNNIGTIIDLKIRRICYLHNYYYFKLPQEKY